MKTRAWNITCLLKTKQNKKQPDPFFIFLSQWTHTHSEWPPHGNLERVQGPVIRWADPHKSSRCVSNAIWHPPASQPASRAALPPLLAPLCLLCAVVAENFLAISVFREIRLQTEYERRNKKRHFDLFLDVQSSLLSLALNISLTLANSPSPSRQRNMHLNEYSSSSMNEPPSHSQQHPTPNHQQ